MFKSEITNRILSLVVLWGIVTFVLFNNDEFWSSPILLSITIVIVVLGTVFHLYKILNLRNSK